MPRARGNTLERALFPITPLSTLVLLPRRVSCLKLTRESGTAEREPARPGHPRQHRRRRGGRKPVDRIHLDDSEEENWDELAAIAALPDPSWEASPDGDSAGSLSGLLTWLWCSNPSQVDPSAPGPIRSSGWVFGFRGRGLDRIDHLRHRRGNPALAWYDPSTGGTVDAPPPPTCTHRLSCCRHPDVTRSAWTVLSGRVSGPSRHRPYRPSGRGSQAFSTRSFPTRRSR